MRVHHPRSVLVDPDRSHTFGGEQPSGLRQVVDDAEALAVGPMKGEAALQSLLTPHSELVEADDRRCGHGVLNV